MSRALAPTERAPSDSYMTDPKLARFIVRLLVERCFIGRGARILEPSAGDGAFVAPLATCAPDVVLQANDLHATPERIASWATMGVESSIGIDFEKLDRPGPGIYDGFDAIVGNPPYSLAERHVRHSLSLLSHGGFLAFLLRVAFLESRQRIAFWGEHPAQSIFVLAERPSFKDGATDSTAYGVFVWRKGVYSHSTKVEVVSWGGRDLQKPNAKEAAE